MRISSERLSILQECGLTESQARVYIALVDHPAGTASSLAKSAELARNRLYESLEELNALGLVDIVLEEPRRYRARSIDSYLDRRTQDLQAKIDRIGSRRPFLLAAFQPREPTAGADNDRGVTQAVSGRRAVAAEIERMLSEARTEIVLAGSVGGSLRLAKHLMDVREVGQRVPIELYVPAAAAGAGGWEMFNDAGIADITWVDAARATLAVIVDREELLRIQPVPDDDRTYVGQDYALMTSNLAIIHDELLGLRSLPRVVGGARSDVLASVRP